MSDVDDRIFLLFVVLNFNRFFDQLFDVSAVVLELDLTFGVANVWRLFAKQFLFWHGKWPVDIQGKIGHDVQVVPKLLVIFLLDGRIELLDDLYNGVCTLCPPFPIFNANYMLNQLLDILSVFFQNELLFI